jgi:hypothetical protein
MHNILFSTYHSSGIDNIGSKMNFTESNRLVMSAFNRWIVSVEQTTNK